MKPKKTLAFQALILFSCTVLSQEIRFDGGRDLLLAQFDCKTDVDDLHTVAAFATLLAHPDYKDIEYHAVAGTYGIQDGLYVPPEELFQLAFDETDWSDAHNHPEKAQQEVLRKVNTTLFNGGQIWDCRCWSIRFLRKMDKGTIGHAAAVGCKETHSYRTAQQLE